MLHVRFETLELIVSCKHTIPPLTVHSWFLQLKRVQSDHGIAADARDDKYESGTNDSDGIQSCDAGTSAVDIPSSDSATISSASTLLTQLQLGGECWYDSGFKAYFS